MIEGSGSVSIPLTNGSGCRRPKNMWIRIRNTGIPRPHEERLRELNLPTLLERLHQMDMAMVHKILGKGGLDHTTWFEKAEDGLRTTRSTADPYNLKVKHGRLDPRRNFFIIRVIEDWNRIPAEVNRVDNSESLKAIYRTQRATQMGHAAR
jgi:hypothetical protein